MDDAWVVRSAAEWDIAKVAGCSRDVCNAENTEMK